MDNFIIDEEYIDPYDLWEERMLEIGKPIAFDFLPEYVPNGVDEELPF